MATLMLTNDNINFMKDRLRQVLPAVKSSHLTEGLAYGAGFNTQAALLAAIKDAPDGRPRLSDMDGIRLSRRLSELGYPDANAGNIDSVTRSSSMPKRIWVEFENGDTNSSNAWFRECQTRDTPLMQIELRKKYVRLSWDCVTIDSRREDHVQGDRGSALVQEMFRTFQRIASRVPGKAKFNGSSFVGSVDDLLPTLAYELADAFFAMLYGPMREHDLTT